MEKLAPRINQDLDSLGTSRLVSCPDLNYQVNCGIRTGFYRVEGITLIKNMGTRILDFLQSNAHVTTERSTVGETRCVGVGSEDGLGEDELAG